MKRFLIVNLFAAVVLLASCGKAEQVSDGTDYGKSSKTVVATKISDFDKIYPVESKAGFSESKREALDVASACMFITEKEEGYADLQLEYVWKYYNRHVDLNIIVSDVPFLMSEDGCVTIEAQSLSGSVKYVDGHAKEWGWTVGTTFSVEATISDNLAASKLSLASGEIYLDVNGFAYEAKEKTGGWAIIEWQDCKIDRFVNSTDKEITIDLGELKVVDEGYTEYELSPFTLAPGESKELEYDSWRYPDDDYYYGLPGEISVGYDGNVYIVKREALVPMKEEYAEEFGRTISIPVYEMDRKCFHYLTDGFLGLCKWPIYVYRITPEVLGL